MAIIGSISSLNVGGAEYDIIANSVTNSAAVWSAVSGNIGEVVGSVYKVKGSKTPTEINALTDMAVGDVYNVTGSSGTIGSETVYIGDNVVYAGTTEGWDKLGASVSLDGYATEDWVNTNYSGAAASAEAASGAIAEAITASGDFTNKNAAKLAQVGAIKGYVDSQISETVEIADSITTTTPTGNIPNVGAVTAYVDSKTSGNYVEYSDTNKYAIATITSGAQTTNISGGNILLSNASNSTDMLYTSTVISGKSRAGYVSLSTDDVAISATDGTTLKASLTGVYETVSSNSASWANPEFSAYNKIQIFTTSGPTVTTANSSAATVGFSASDNIELIATAYNPANPVIGISAKDTTYDSLSAISTDEYNILTAVSGLTGRPELSVEGSNGVTADINTTTQKLSLSGVDATSAAAGVTKASYYSAAEGSTIGTLYVF